MGILDFLQSPKFGTGLMALGEALSASGYNRPANFKHIIKMQQDAKRRQQMADLAGKFAAPGVLGKMFPNMTPETLEAMRKATGTMPGAILPHIIRGAMSPKTASPFAGLMKVGNTIVRRNPTTGAIEPVYTAPANPLVSIGMPEMEKSYDKAAGTALAKSYEGYRESAAGAADTLDLTGKMRAMLTDPAITTGFGAETLSEGKRLLKQLGVPGVEGIDSASAFVAMSNKLSLKGMEAIKGVASDADMRKVDASIAKLGDTKEAALLKLDIIEDAAKQQERIFAAANEWARTHGGRLTPEWNAKYLQLRREWREKSLAKINEYMATKRRRDVRSMSDADLMERARKLGVKVPASAGSPAAAPIPPALRE